MYIVAEDLFRKQQVTRVHFPPKNNALNSLPSQLGSTQQYHPDTFLDGWRGEAGRRSQTHRKHSGGSPDSPSSLSQSVAKKKKRKKER